MAQQPLCSRRHRHSWPNFVIKSCVAELLTQTHTSMHALSRKSYTTVCNIVQTTLSIAN